MNDLRAFHGDPGLKEMYLARVMLHRQADELVQGTGWKDGKGCAVGCTLEAYDHALYPVELGIPLVLAHLEDRIFERLPRADAQTWPERFLDAPNPGADLSDVWPRFAIWMLDDPEAGVIRFTRTEAQRSAVRAVADLYRERAPASDPRWRKARAADAYAADAAAAYAARSAHWQRCADKLIELMTSAPVPKKGR